MKDDSQKWLQTAESDLAVASLAHEHGYYNQCVFHCQQALEKLLKAIWIERLGKTHPRTHNLAALLLELEIEASEDQLLFFQDLTEQYLPSHYVDVEVEYPEEVSADYLSRTKEAFPWLRQHLS